MGVSIWCDGACNPHNPGGHGTYGFVIKEGSEMIAEEKGHLGKSPEMTNNVAEYKAVEHALGFLLDLDREFDQLHLHSDSELVINQLRGEWQVNSPRLLPKFAVTKTLLDKLEENHHVQLQHVDRSNNKHADRLSQEAYKDHLYAEQRETALSQTHEVQAIGNRKYEVDSEEVNLHTGTCTCSPHQNHDAKCVHIFKAELLEAGEF